MTPAPLPLAPRPREGESPSSWVIRTAARYSIGGGDLARCILSERCVIAGRVDSLDHSVDPEFEAALASASRIDPMTIAALRVVTGDGSASAWHRDWAVWCAQCLRDDSSRHGEVYGRAIWRLGCCVLCPVHGVPLQAACHVCTRERRCTFRHASGRLRLTCDGCGRHVDADGAVAAFDGFEWPVLSRSS